MERGLFDELEVKRECLSRVVYDGVQYNDLKRKEEGRKATGKH